jgi:hypothetical protein
MLALLLSLLPAAARAEVRYQREANLITVDGASMTLSGIKAAIPSAPLERVDPARHVWLLSASLLLKNGSALRLHGRGAGGDVDELRLRSDNGAGGRVVSITADHGSIDIRATRILSWDSATRGPDLEWETWGRAFIRARSRMRAMVLTRLESRMDVVDSDVGWLGYGSNESYGLVWKVVAPDPFVLENVRVHGSVLRSHIHHNYFGLYAAGARDNEWIGNRVDHNVQYGMAPHLRSNDMVIQDNDVYENGHHGITVRQHCARIAIRHNRVWNNDKDGIAVHGGSNNGQVVDNQVFRNGGSGITAFDVAGVTVRGKRVQYNGQSVIQLVLGARDNVVEGNDVRGSAVYGVFVGPGHGRTAAGRDSMPRRNRITGNRIYGSRVANVRTADLALNTWADNAEVPAAGALAVKDGAAPRPPVPSQPPLASQPP